ncbi:hypothetical protein, partial [Stenotrophomonas maltophilia]|uniref:hypothetical protein n=1 Tax=Stenotrophomonas maltophilia TaxID=40324 RepID=UPI0013DBFF45
MPSEVELLSLRSGRVPAKGRVRMTSREKGDQGLAAGMTAETIGSPRSPSEVVLLALIPSDTEKAPTGRVMPALKDR